MAIDLDSYFRRIGYAGDCTPTLDTLRAICRLHLQAIPYENLNPLMKWPVPLDAQSLEQKLVRSGRGGYCYENNLFFSHVLRTLGYQIRELGARSVWNLPEDAPTARTHMILRVILEGQPFIVDVGWGVATMTAPLRLEVDIEQPTPHGPWRISKLDEEFVATVKMSDKWTALYRFDMQEQFLSDFELMNWYSSTHPTSMFVNNLMVARPDEHRRYSLRNNILTTRQTDGAMERRTLESTTELRWVLESVFNLTLPEANELDSVLDRFAHYSE